MSEVPDCAISQQTLGDLGLRVVPPHQALDAVPAAAFGGVKTRRGVGGGHRERLFAEHVLSGLKRPDGPLGVKSDGQRDVDGIDSVVAQQVIVRAVTTRDAEIGRVRPRPRCIPAAYRHHFGIG
jgi:hypothetical protein